LLLACSCKSRGASTDDGAANEKPAPAHVATTTAAEVCAHMDALREQEGRPPADDCARAMTMTQQLDGQQLWSLRARCITNSTRLAEAHRCNRAHQPDWPAPSGRHDGSSTRPPDELPRPTSLCEAARLGDLAAVERMLADAAQRQSVCPDGFGAGARIDALMAAAAVGESRVVRVLVEAGFDPLKPDDAGRSAYVWAASGNHIDVVDYFWAQDARPPAKDPFIGAVLYSAALWGRLAILEHYQAQSADLDAQHHGYTPIMGAAQGGHLEVVKWLVAHGADPQRALEQARRFGHEEVVEYLQTSVRAAGE
jgi:hypothetical protein